MKTNYLPLGLGSAATMHREMGSTRAPMWSDRRPAGQNRRVVRFLQVIFFAGALAVVPGRAEAPDAEKSSYLSNDDGCPTIPIRDLYRLKATYENCPAASDIGNDGKTVDLFRYLPEGCGECIYQLRLGLKARIPVTGGDVVAAYVHGKTITFATGTPSGSCPMVEKTTNIVVFISTGEKFGFSYAPAQDPSLSVNQGYVEITSVDLERRARPPKTGCGTGLNCNRHNIINPWNGSVSAIMQFGGSVRVLPRGLQYGTLSLREPAKSGALCTPALLAYQSPGSDVEVIRDATSARSLRQIKGADGLLDIVTMSASEYELRHYAPANAGSKVNGLYQPINTWEAKWTIRDANPGGAECSDLLIIETRGATTRTTEFVWSDTDQGWTLKSPSNLANDRKVTQWLNNNTLLVETRDLQTNTTTVLRQVEKSQVFDWGTNLVERTLNPGAATEKKTTYDYWTGPNDYGYSQLKLETLPNGFWKYYEYDSVGRLSRVLSPFLNQAFTTNSSLGRLTTFDYTPLAGSGDAGSNTNLARTTVEYVMGNEVARSYLVLKAYEKREIQCTVPGDAWSSGNNLVAITTYYSSGSFSNEVYSVRRPDNTMTLFEYSTNSTQLTDTVYDGQPNGGYTAVVSGTKTVTVRGLAGQTLSRSTYDIASNLLTSQETYSQFDALNRPQRTTFLDGTYTESIYGCCGLESERDRDGVQTTYLYDDLHRLVVKTRLNISSYYTYDSAGHLLYEIRQGTDGSAVLMRSANYDLGGFLLSETNALGGVTSFTENLDIATGQVTRTTTQPDGGTRIELFARDRSLLKVTGTAIRPVRFEYGVELDGGVNRLYTREIKLDAGGADSTEWTKTYLDFAGRTYKTVFAAAAAPYPYRQSFFNAAGQAWKEIDPDGMRVLYQYNGRGELEYTALDLNQNDVIDFIGSDRITQTVTDVVANYGTSVRRTRTYGWDTLNVNNALLRQTVERSVNGLKTWTTAGGVTSRTETSIPSSGNRYETSYAPDGSSVVNYFQNGRLLTATRLDASGAQIGQTTFAYDGHGRQQTVTDARTGATTYAYNNADLVTSVTTPVPASGQSAQTTTTLYNTMLQAYQINQPDGTTVNHEFYLTGDLKKTYGSRTYPVEYTYDTQDRLKTMKTWQNYSGGTGAYLTTWNYDAYRGFLSNKRDANNYGPNYTYTAAGRLATRTWARGIVCSYGCGAGGDLQSVSYSDGQTPAVSYIQDRLGRSATVTRNGLTTTLTYNTTDQVLSESYSGGALGGLAVNRTYDALLRRSSVALNTQPSTLNSFAYDNAGRLQSVSDNVYSATYGYLANSPLVNQITFKQNSTWRMNIGRQFDNLNRLTSITDTPAGSQGWSYAYQYNTANQRTRVTLADGSYWQYGYDSLGQVSSGKRYWSDNGPVPGQQFEYTHDSIGNRTTAKMGGDSAGGNLRTASYTPNSLNQYSSRSVPTGVDIVGESDPAATVTVNGQSTYRRSTYYQAVVTVNNSAAAVYQGVTVSKTGTTVSGNKFVPKTPESYLYDLDGNVTSDGRWNYTWDGENRLVRMESLPSAPAASKRLLVFAYDWQGRRIEKAVYNGSSGSYVLSGSTKMIYDGWNVLAELGANNGLIRSYLWGLDLSGSLGGAGGVGGLLAVRTASGVAHFAAYDGNGNVIALVDGTTGNVSAQYEYGPFGEPIRVTGTMGKANPFRWSTKYTEEEMELVYYGYRYYSSSTGRWLSRDPIEERGGPNLYGLTDNDPVGRFDALGLFQSPEHEALTSGAVDAVSPLLGLPNSRLTIIKKILVAANRSQDSGKKFADLKRHYNRPYTVGGETEVQRELNREAFDTAFGAYLKEEIGRFEKAIEKQDCYNALVSLGLLAHSWQDFYSHAIARDGTIGFQAWSNGIRNTPDQRDKVWPSSYYTANGDVVGLKGEHPNLGEPTRGREFALRYAEALDFTQTKFAVLLKQWVKTCPALCGPPTIDLSW